MFIHNGIEIDINMPLTLGDVQYPAGWFDAPEVRAAHSIFQIDGAPPLVGVNQTVTRTGLAQDGNGVWAVQWAVHNMTADEIAARDQAAAQELAALKQELVDGVDDTIATIIARWTRFQAGYEKREAAARAFKAANYAGDPGVWVTAFSSNAGMSNTAAANLIISQADALHGALEALEALRMAKYGIVAATGATAAQTAYTAILTQANTIAASLT